MMPLESTLRTSLVAHSIIRIPRAKRIRYKLPSRGSLIPYDCAVCAMFQKTRLILGDLDKIRSEPLIADALRKEAIYREHQARTGHTPMRHGEPRAAVRHYHIPKDTSIRARGALFDMKKHIYRLKFLAEIEDEQIAPLSLLELRSKMRDYVITSTG